MTPQLDDGRSVDPADAEGSMIPPIVRPRRAVVFGGCAFIALLVVVAMSTSRDRASREEQPPTRRIRPPSTEAERLPFLDAAEHELAREAAAQRAAHEAGAGTHPPVGPAGREYRSYSAADLPIAERIEQADAATEERRAGFRSAMLAQAVESFASGPGSSFAGSNASGRAPMAASDQIGGTRASRRALVSGDGAPEGEAAGLASFLNATGALGSRAGAVETTLLIPDPGLANPLSLEPPPIGPRIDHAAVSATTAGADEAIGVSAPAVLAFPAGAPWTAGGSRLAADMVQLSGPPAAGSAAAVMSRPVHPTPELYRLPARTLVSGTLITAINSDLPGQITAQVTRDVYDAAIQRVLIPRGSFLVGSYSDQVALGGNRLLVAWTQLELPSGTVYELPGLRAADPMGAAGLPGRVDHHYRQVFGSAALLSIVSAGLQLSQPPPRHDGRSASAQEQMAGALGLELGRVATEIVRRNLKISPTVRVPQGTEFRVFVGRDLLMPEFARDRGSP